MPDVSSPGPGRGDSILGLHRFALLTAGATFVLIFVGGLVTSTGSGLAVPDWPLSFGQVFPPMVGGVLYEHGHRLTAALVGVLTTVLAIWIWVRERRAWVRRLGIGALFAILLQGLLGGLTVLTLLPAPVSVAHALLAQVFFCLTVTLAVVTGPGWAGRAAPSAGGIAPGLPTLCALTVGAIFGQLILGAVMRHTGAGLAIPDFPLAFGRLLPPLDSEAVLIHFLHRVGAVLVTACVGWTLVRILARHRKDAWLLRPALAAAGLLVVQLALGALTIWTQKAVLPTTAHVAGGAGMLAASLTLTLRAFRLSAWRKPVAGPELVRGQVPA
jgi:cytochrome c oxidase assembly protein subunit 15